MNRTKLTVPHSWGIDTWPEFVWPHSPSRARYVLRANRDELTHAGAISRVGRELVVLGERYSRWLERRTAEVPGYDCPPNRSNESTASAA